MVRVNALLFHWIPDQVRYDGFRLLAAAFRHPGRRSPSSRNFRRKYPGSSQNLHGRKADNIVVHYSTYLMVGGLHLAELSFQKFIDMGVQEFTDIAV